MNRLVLKPSHWINFGWFIIMGLGTIFLPTLNPLLPFVPILIYLWKTLEVHTWSYNFGPEYMTEKKGILHVTHTETHYFRIKSIKIEEPLLYRMVGIANVYIITSDKFDHEVVLRGVVGSMELRKQLQTMINQQRRDKGVREIDMYDM